MDKTNSKTSTKPKKQKVVYSTTLELVEAVAQSTLQTAFTVNRKIRECGGNDDPELAETWSKAAQNLATTSAVLLSTLQAQRALAPRAIETPVIPAWEVCISTLRALKQEHENNSDVDTSLLDSAIKRIGEIWQPEKKE